MRHGNTRRGIAAAKGPGDIVSIQSGSGYVGSVFKSIVAGGNWQRDGVDIPGATGTTYTITVADEGHAIGFKPTNEPLSNQIEMFIPSDIAAPVLWLDAYYTDGITFGNGSFVAGVASRSGGINMLQANAGLQPNYSATGRNGRPAFIMAQGKVLQADTPGGMPGAGVASTTISLAYAGPNITSNNYRALVGWGFGNSVGQYRVVGKNSSGNRVLALTSAELLSDPAVIYSEMDRLTSAEFTGSGAELIVDGQYVTGNAMGLPNGATTYCNFGMGRNNDPRQWDGSAQETITYAGVLTEPQRQQVEGYIAHRWGVASRLPADHPYRHSAPRAA